MRDDYTKMLCEAHNIRLGEKVKVEEEPEILTESVEVVLEDNPITWFKSRNINIQDARGGVNPMTVFLAVSGWFIGMAVSGAAEVEGRPLTSLVAFAGALLALMWGNKKIKEESKAILALPPKERVVKYSAKRVMGAHVMEMAPQINKSIAIGKGVDYKIRSKHILKVYEILKKKAQDYLKIAPQDQKAGYRQSILRLDINIDKMKERVK